MSGLSWLDTLVDLDLDAISEQINKSVEEASRIIDEVNNLEILNLDAMAVKQEEDERAQLENEGEDEDNDIEVLISMEECIQKGRENIASDIDVETCIHEKSSSFPTKVRKLPSENEEWSMDFSNADETLDEVSLKSIPEVSKILESNSQRNIFEDTLNGVETCSTSLQPMETMIPMDDASSSQLEYPLDDNVKVSIYPNISLDDNLTIKKKKKKNKRNKKTNRDKGLDFWGFGSVEATCTSHTYDIETNQPASEVTDQDVIYTESVVDIAQKLPQRLVSGILGTSPFSYSYFDKIEEEIDLTDDPILKSVEDNKNKPKISSSSNSARLYASTLLSYPEIESSSNASSTISDTRQNIFNATVVNQSDESADCTSIIHVIIQYSFITVVSCINFLVSISGVILNYFTSISGPFRVDGSMRRSIWDDLQRPEVCLQLVFHTKTVTVDNFF